MEQEEGEEDKKETSAVVADMVIAQIGIAVETVEADFDIDFVLVGVVAVGMIVVVVVVVKIH